MDFFQLVQQRESVRGYLPQKVEREKINKILETARLAPSACNAQAWNFIVVDNDNLVKEVANALHDPLVGGINKFSHTSPCFIVILDDKRNLTSGIGGKLKQKDYTSMDIGIAAEHICLAATELGLGTCMMGWFKEKKLKTLLNIPKNREIHLVISLGYYNYTEPRKKVRKQFDDIVKYNSY